MPNGIVSARLVGRRLLVEAPNNGASSEQAENRIDPSPGISLVGSAPRAQSGSCPPSAGSRRLQ
jgi:hypothetical protein